jgi:hypothetical protein
MLEPGGFLLAEVERTWSDRSDFASVRSKLGDVGFEDIFFHWHRPSFGSCLEIVPVEERAVVGWFLHRRPQSRRAAMKLWLLRLVRRLGRLDHAVTSYSVLARKRGDDR